MKTTMAKLLYLINNKKRGNLILIASLLLVLVPGFALAVPNLQIYIPGATYDTATETWIVNSFDYELWVIGANLPIYDVKFAAAIPYSDIGKGGSITVTWEKGECITPDGTTAKGPGYTDILTEITGYSDDLSIYFTDEPATPIMGDGVTQVPDHGVFPTPYYEYYIGDFCSGMTKDNKEDYERVYDYVPPDPEDEYEIMTDDYGNTAYGWGYGEIKKFHILASGYPWVDIVAYDHYIQANESIHCTFTPFSHDGAHAPEPASMLLLGTGLVGLGILGRKKQKRQKLN